MRVVIGRMTRKIWFLNVRRVTWKKKDISHWNRWDHRKRDKGRRLSWKSWSESLYTKHLSNSRIQIASFENDNSKSWSWPGVKVLQLKQGCRIMPMWNLYDNLKNGSMGVLTGVQGNNLHFLWQFWCWWDCPENIYEEKLDSAKMKTSQVPLILPYDVTCHEPHCHYALLMGLFLIFYVAISRVKSPLRFKILALSSF